MSDVEVCDVFMEILSEIRAKGRLTGNCGASKFNSEGSLAGCDVATGLVVDGEIEDPVRVTVSGKHDNIVNFVVDDVV